MGVAAMAKAAMASIAATCNGENGEHAASGGADSESKDGDGEAGDGEQAERYHDGEGEHRHAAWRGWGGGDAGHRRPPHRRRHCLDVARHARHSPRYT